MIKLDDGTKVTFIDIFYELDSDKYTDVQKLAAITYVLSNPNKVPKGAIVDAFKWFVNSSEFEGNLSSLLLDVIKLRIHDNSGYNKDLTDVKNESYIKEKTAVDIINQVSEVFNKGDQL